MAVDYSDLSLLDDEQIDTYNKIGWTRNLFTAKDRVLLNQRMGEMFISNSQYVRTTLADCMVVLDLNNKIVIVAGKYGNEKIEGVLTFNAISETDAELYKEVFYDDTQREGSSKEKCREWFEINQSYIGNGIVRVYSCHDYRYYKNRENKGVRAPLPDYW